MGTDPPLSPKAPVLIVGAGPVGLSLALGLARQGVRSIVVEEDEGTTERSRAPGIQLRTREIFAQWGIEARFTATGTLRRTLALHSVDSGRGPLAVVDFSDLEPEADRPGLLILEQAHTERILLEAVRASGRSEVRFSTEAVALEQSPKGVVVTVQEGEREDRLEAEYVVGCDGASSFVREALGLPFEGRTYSVRPMLADVEIEDARDGLPWPRTRNGRGGITTGIRLQRGVWRIIRLERGDPDSDETVESAELDTRVAEVLGEGEYRVLWASRFRIHRRASPRFRVDRVLLAGDAAHVHSPAGGLGMNGGIQDAHNLAWKLAQALRGGDVDALLDSYEVERRAVMVGPVSAYTDFITRAFLQAPVAFRTVSFLALRTLLRIGPLRRRSLRRMAMIDLDYPPSPLLDPDQRSAGVRLPNVELRAADGSRRRLHDLLPPGPALLTVGDPGDPDPGLPVDATIRIGSGGCDDPAGSLRRLLGGRDGWILVRPDRHIGWARTDREGMAEAIGKALGSA